MKEPTAQLHLDGYKQYALTRHLSAARVSTVADRYFLGVETRHRLDIH